MSEKLTPTQDLIMELLAARYRLGESLWPFDNRTRVAAAGLEQKGLITTMHGNVENTYRARLTVEGRKRYLTDSYVPPFLKGHEKATARWRRTQ